MSLSLERLGRVLKIDCRGWDPGMQCRIYEAGLSGNRPETVSIRATGRLADPELMRGAGPRAPYHHVAGGPMEFAEQRCGQHFGKTSPAGGHLAVLEYGREIQA